MTVSPVMQRLASYIAQAPKKRLPLPVAEKVKHHVLDTLAAMISGARLLPGRKAIAYARSRGGVAEASVVTTRLVTTAENAALANGMLAHADETDDSHAPSLTHPGCGIVPARRPGKLPPEIDAAQARVKELEGRLAALALDAWPGCQAGMTVTALPDDHLPVSRGLSRAGTRTRLKSGEAD